MERENCMLWPAVRRSRGGEALTKGEEGNAFDEDAKTSNSRT